jgi:hypothetical protein
VQEVTDLPFFGAVCISEALDAVACLGVTDTQDTIVARLAWGCAGRMAIAGGIFTIGVTVAIVVDQVIADRLEIAHIVVVRVKTLTTI